MTRLGLRHPRAALAAWGVVIATLSVLGLGVEGRLHRLDISVGGTSGARADALAHRYFGDSATLVVMLRGPRSALDREGPALAARLQRRGLAVVDPW